MPNPRLAERYAKSLIDLATEKGQLEQVYADMKYLKAVCKASRDFVNLLKSPIIKSDLKNSAIKAIIKDNVGELTGAFTHLLVKKGRESDLPEITIAFVAQYNKIKGIHVVHLTTATDISEDSKQRIVARIQKDTGLENIEMETITDEKLIGGLVLEFNNHVVDASILSDLKELKKMFKKNIFVQELR